MEIPFKLMISPDSPGRCSWKLGFTFNRENWGLDKKCFPRILSVSYVALCRPLPVPGVTILRPLMAPTFPAIPCEM
ncbi:hypothetical protein GDO81_029623 [Engystomops pustulosus]|uniref:Uncharacterized protein n=1 Tax=Engystomops pustulosus TaxID=76066 RepID=A0AAV6YE42_ENGPU|nr:hypothetical protein GDO81_029623 [Engystomops pustulosus]